MECKDYREQFASFLNNTLDQKRRNEIESHLAVCADCREEFETFEKIWNLMGEMPQPEPSEALREGFNTVLSDYREELNERKNPIVEWMNKLSEFWALQTQPRLAFSLLLVALGLIGGYLLHQPGQSATSYNR